eukprot:852803-Prymnesium_polylepis.1
MHQKTRVVARLWAVLAAGRGDRGRLLLSAVWQVLAAHSRQWDGGGLGHDRVRPISGGDQRTNLRAGSVDEFGIGSVHAHVPGRARGRRGSDATVPRAACSVQGGGVG